MANTRKADNVHLLEGTFRKDRHGDPKKKPKLKLKLPAMPSWISTDAKKEWKRICKVLENAGILTEADRSTLIQYCILYADLKELQEKFTPPKHAQLRICCCELGLTPSARSKITVDNDDEGDDF